MLGRSIGAVIAALLMLCTSRVFGQMSMSVRNQGATNGGEALVRMLAKIEEKTRATSRISPDGLRIAVAKKIGLTDQEFAVFSNSCRSAADQIRALDEEASAIITTIRARHKGKGKNGGIVPPPPARLLALQNQKASIVAATIATLPAIARSKVDVYLASLQGPAKTAVGK